MTFGYENFLCFHRMTTPWSIIQRYGQPLNKTLKQSQIEHKTSRTREHYGHSDEWSSRIWHCHSARMKFHRQYQLNESLTHRNRSLPTFKTSQTVGDTEFRPTNNSKTKFYLKRNLARWKLRKKKFLRFPEPSDTSVEDYKRHKFLKVVQVQVTRQYHHTTGKISKTLYHTILKSENKWRNVQ